MYSEKLLLVDDEQGLLDMLTITLQKEQYNNITCATTAAQALDYVRREPFDLILLDVMLPDGSGLDVCSQIRAITYTPIIFVTARTTDFDKLTGLAIGGDDYITKPFNPLEVVARIKAILRRQQHYRTEAAGQTHMADEKTLQQVYEYESFTLNPNTAVLTVGGEQVDCTAKEFELLRFFCKHPNLVFTTAQLYEQVWDELVLGDEKTVTMHISRLRKKIGDDARSPSVILNMRGIGYKFVPPEKR